MRIKIKIGDKASIYKIFTESDVELFSKLSLDKNPIHLDDSFAANTIFGKRIVHGILVSGLISATIANKLPGEGSIYLSQSLQFMKPIFIGEKVTAIVEVIKMRADKPVITLNTKCVNEINEIVIQGEAIVLLQ